MLHFKLEFTNINDSYIIWPISHPKQALKNVALLEHIAIPTPGQFYADFRLLDYFIKQSAIVDIALILNEL
jgi:hypothetical protein